MHAVKPSSLAVVAAVVSICASAFSYEPPAGISDPSWGALHPIDTPVPDQPSEWPSGEAYGKYYIDNTHASATDGGNEFGTPNKPRMTIPERAFAAGSYIEIHGGPYFARVGDKEIDMDFVGTEENPCWVVGSSAENLTELKGAMEFSGEYVFFQWIRFTRDEVIEKGPAVNLGGELGEGDHMVLRQCVIQGDGVHHENEKAALTLTGSSSDELSEIVIYEIEIFDIDSVIYSQTVEVGEGHGVLIEGYVDNVWILESNIHDVAGNGIKIVGGDSIGGSQEPQFSIGGNAVHGNGGSPVDTGTSSGVTLSENELDASMLIPVSEKSLKIDRVPDGSLKLLWSSTVGNSYRVMQNQSLFVGSWTELAAARSGTGSTMEYTIGSSVVLTDTYYSVLRTVLE